MSNLLEDFQRKVGPLMQMEWRERDIERANFISIYETFFFSSLKKLSVEKHFVFPWGTHQGALFLYGQRENFRSPVPDGIFLVITYRGKIIFSHKFGKSCSYQQHFQKLHHYLHIGTYFGLVSLGGTINIIRVCGFNWVYQGNLFLSDSYSPLNY